MKHNFLKFLLAGIVLLGTSINLWAWDVTFYCVPKAMWGDDWTSSKSVRTNFNNGDGGWMWQTMTPTGKYYKGNEIYTTTFTNKAGNGGKEIQFQRYNGSSQENSWQCYNDWVGMDWIKSHLFDGSWQDYKTDPVFNYAHLYYTKNGESKNYKFDGTKDPYDLGTITSSLEITNIYLNFNKNGGNVCDTKNNGAMHYKKDGGTTIDVQPTDKWSWSGSSDPYELQWKNITGKTIASSTEPSGNHTLSIWWELKGDYAGESNCTDVSWYLSNNSNNYTWTYTILPPAVSNFAVSASGYKSGSGTSSDPYLVKYGTQLSLSASSNKAHDDGNSHRNYSFALGSYSTTNTYTSESLTASGKITVKACCINTSDSNLKGAESSTDVYYTVVYTDLQIEDVGCTVDPASYLSSTQVAKGSSVSITQGTPATGYEFDSYSCTNGSVTDNAFKPTANNAKVTVNWTAKTYTITLDGNGATVAGTPTQITATYDQQLPASLSNFTAPQKTGYVFLGYYDDAIEGQGIQYYNASGVRTWNENWTTDAGATLYAQWHVQTYKVTFGVHSTGNGILEAEVDNVAITSPADVDASATVTFTATPATDYVVEGWYSDEACTERIEAAKAHTEYSITLTENTEVYVKFAQAYTVHFGEIGDLIDKGELAVTYYDESIVDGAQVAEGSNVVFSATNLTTNYTVQGWFADQQAKNSLEGVSGYAVSDDRKTLTATISEDVNVYVRYFAPEIVSAIALKVDGAVPTVYQIGETITAEPTTTGGDGTKVYNWQLKQDGVPVTTTFSPDGKKVSFNVESTGNYTITLTINDATTGFFNSTCTSDVFEVKEPVYYIVGSHFWGTDNLATLNTKATQQDHSAIGCDGAKDVHLQPTMEKGVYYFGPWTFGQDYDAFWIYDAIKHKSMSGTAENGYYATGQGHESYESGIALVETQTGLSGFYTNNQESSGHSDLGQHNWYLFVKNGKVWFNKNAPDLTAYVRLVVTADKQYYSNEILMPEDGAQSEILSFYSNAEATKYEIQKQEPGKGWQKLQDVTVSSISEGGIYTITFTKSGDDITMGTPAAYTGDYYVRTDALNSWDDYKTNPLAKMRYTEGARNNAFNYYLCKWCDNENINVHFAVANDYNSNLLGTYTNDVICTEGKLLGQKASVRFMFMHKTGELARAYLCGTIEDQFLRVINNQSSSKKIYSDEEQTQEVTDLKFEDSQDFVYPIDVYAQPGAQIALRAKYKNYYQFFYGAGNADGTVTSYDYLIGDNTSTDNNAYHMQMVYDFKTDRLVAGWIPGDEEINGRIDLHSDAIITREHQEDLRSIRFANDESGIFHVKTLYAELQLNKSIMTDGHTQEATYIYDRNIYWISFPFNVRVGDIFGVDGYGTKWVIQKYNGAKRAQIGWFAETSTFWEQMDEDDIMEANVGYSLNLDPDFFDQESDEVWSNGKASVSFRFPSMIHNFDVISNGVAKSLIPEHTCTIDREFGEPKKNHKNTDSNWNVFGIPTFENLVNPKGLPFDSYYIYNPSSNTYTPQATTNDAEFTLKASYSYFIQWGREELVTWPKASIINELASAPKYNYADEKNYMVELFFNGNGAEDHTYINLADAANEDFVLNEDMMKMTNSGKPNIYSYAGAYDVAYNKTAFQNQIVTLGVSAPKNGTYTFSMPKEFSGTAQLFDMEDGSITDLNVSNYTVELNKGTYNNRFQLLLEVEAKVPTSIQADRLNGGEAEGKTLKLLRNGNIYLINGGRVYNATGVQLR